MTSMEAFESFRFLGAMLISTLLVGSDIVQRCRGGAGPTLVIGEWAEPVVASIVNWFRSFTNKSRGELARNAATAVSLLGVSLCAFGLVLWSWWLGFGGMLIMLMQAGSLRRRAKEFENQDALSSDMVRVEDEVWRIRNIGLGLVFAVLTWPMLGQWFVAATEALIVFVCGMRPGPPPDKVTLRERMRIKSPKANTVIRGV